MNKKQTDKVAYIQFENESDKTSLYNTGKDTLVKSSSETIGRDTRPKFSDLHGIKEIESKINIMVFITAMAYLIMTADFEANLWGFFYRNSPDHSLAVVKDIEFMRNVYLFTSIIVLSAGTVAFLEKIESFSLSTWLMTVLWIISVFIYFASILDTFRIGNNEKGIKSENLLSELSVKARAMYVFILFNTVVALCMSVYFTSRVVFKKKQLRSRGESSTIHDLPITKIFFCISFITTLLLWCFILYMNSNTLIVYDKLLEICRIAVAE